MKFREWFNRNKILNEKSLSRIWKHMQDHDTGTISGYRTWKFKTDEKGNPLPEISDKKYSHKENQQRNRKLQALIQSKRYNLISVKGSYIENFGEPNAVESGEHTFFVVDVNDTGNLEKDLRKWGEELWQDSVMFIPKGASTATLWGTNIIKQNAYPGYKKKIVYNVRKLGSKGEFFTKVGNKPFSFEKIKEVYNLPDGYLGRWACATTSKEDWKDIEV